MPIVKKTSLSGGNVKVDRFGGFFIRNQAANNGDLTLEYIGTDIVIGNGSSTGGSGFAGLTVPVLYR